MDMSLAILGPVSAQIAFVLELTLVPILLPSIQSEFDLSLMETAWVFNAYSVAMAIGIAICALRGDRFSPSRVFGLGVGLFVVGSLWIGIATTDVALIIGRALQGFGAGIFSPLIPVLLTRAASDRPGRALILWGSTAGYIAAFAPLVYGGLFGGADWNLAFLSIAFAAALSLLLLSFSRDVGNSPPPLANATLYRALFESRELWVAYAYVFTTYGAITYFLFRIPLSLTETGTDTLGIGIVLSVLWMSFSLLSALLRNWVDDHRLKIIMIAAPILVALGAFLVLSSNILVVVFSACLVGCGLACSNAPSTQMVLRFAPQGLTTLATSVDITVARLSGIVTVTVLAGLSLPVAFGAIMVLSALAVVCAYYVTNKAAKL
ncbi:MAG: MFS transporter [Marinovum sp.]|nr:MFS transporter [Marinovum sp.]